MYFWSYLFKLGVKHQLSHVIQRNDSVDPTAGLTTCVAPRPRRYAVYPDVLAQNKFQFQTLVQFT